MQNKNADISYSAYWHLRNMGPEMLPWGQANSLLNVWKNQTRRAFIDGRRVTLELHLTYSALRGGKRWFGSLISQETEEYILPSRCLFMTKRQRVSRSFSSNEI